MANTIVTIPLEDAIMELKQQISSNVSCTQLAKCYLSVINGFDNYYADLTSMNPLEALEEYYFVVTHVKAYNHPHSKYLRRKARPILMLKDILLGDVTKRKYCYGTTCFPDPFSEDTNTYRHWMITDGKSESTIRTRMGRIKIFLLYLSKNNCFSINEITISNVTNFIIELNGKYSYQGKASILYTVKSFFSCPVIKDKLSCDPSPLLCGLHSRKHERLPSVFSSNEIKRILESVDRNEKQGKMLYLMMLLSAVYGLRSSDIRQVEISSFNLRKMTIFLCQQKTKQVIELPLIEDVLLALLDYLKNARPRVEDSHVFIKQRSPHIPYSTNNHFANKVGTYFRKADIDVRSKHHGLHSMRHSLATELIASAVPINEVSTILGHTTLQATMTYIWADLVHLRAAALEVLPYDK